MQKIRILTFGLKSDIMGGIESFMLNMNEHMVKEDFIFDYVFLDKDSLIHREQVERLCGNIFFLPYYVMHPIGYVKELYKLLKEQKTNCDAIYVHLFSMVHILPIIVGRLMGYKVIIHAHNSNIPHQSTTYRILNSIGRFVCSHLNCLRIANSNASSLFLYGKSKSKETKIVYNAIDVKKFKYNDDARYQMKKSLSIEDKYVVGFTGRLSTEKNPLFVLEIFRKFHKQNPDSVLIMAGEGPLLKDVQDILQQDFDLKKSVKLLGQRNDMQDLYQAMDVLLLPSLFEGLGIVLVEAQAAGLPCLTSEEVVPKMIEVTDLVSRENLGKGCQAWAERLVDIRKQDTKERTTYNNEVMISPFNIQTEAKRFGTIIKEYVG